MKSALILLLICAFVGCQNSPLQIDRLGLQNKLQGKWKAKAFDGELHERWKLSDDGWMIQEGFYIENGDTTFSSITTIETIANELLLISVIKESNPKIFKATTQRENEIVFENDDYKNPFKVHYEFMTDQLYRRTITGYEKDSLVNYIFNFEKVE